MKKMKIGTQDRRFFRKTFWRNFVISKRWASMVLRLTANCWLTTFEEVKAAIEETGLRVTTGLRWL
ncbi:hypothetical protein ACLK1T_29010 [Escherichia coli]